MIEYESEEEKKAATPSSKKSNPAKKAVVITEPKNWQKMWTGIQKMRKENLAAVDTMGCDQVHEKTASKEDRAYHTLVSLMLSAQTKDEVTHATTDYLVREKNLSVKTIVATNTDDLNTWIAKVGFHNKKAVYIKKST